MIEIKIEFSDLEITLKNNDSRQSVTDTFIILGVILGKFREWKHGSPKVTQKGKELKRKDFTKPLGKKKGTK